MKKNLHVGGVVAAGFDSTGEYLLVISHSGRGVFSTGTWERVARDNELVYSQDGIGLGIGPIDGQKIVVKELNSQSETLTLTAPDGKTVLKYEEGCIEIGNS